MADIHFLLTLGIGTPGDIAHLILVGLNTNPSLTSADLVIEMRADDALMAMSVGDYVIDLPADDLRAL